MTAERIEGSGTAPSYQSAFASIALPVPVRAFFTYRVPEGLGGSALPGCRAIVPFGRRRLTGVIASLEAEPGIESAKVKDVLALPDREPPIAPPLLAALLWAARYYVASPGAMLAAALPPGAGRGEAQHERAVEIFYALAVPREQALEASARAPLQRRVIEALAEIGGSLSSAELRGRVGEAGAALSALRRKRIVAAERRVIARPPAILEAEAGRPAVTLTGEQRAAVSAVTAALDQGYKGFLLFGPTGSGKTEVYFSVIEESLRRGRPAIFLVPEISLTPLLARTMKARFGERFALMHSSLTPAQRRHEWDRARSGEARVVLGPRSALLSPVPSPGVIVVDEEQDSSFKQEGDPRYNARDLALVRAQREGCPALLGSATPSMESYRLAETGRLTLLRLSQRIEARPLPEVELVDMREEEERTGGDDPISRRLREELRACVERREQAIVLLNRRGWSPSVQCRKCGENVMCRRCTIALTWHRADRRLLCHYCGYQRGLPSSCPACGSQKLTFAGAGTERLAEDLKAIFPEARFARLDRDVARGRTEPGRILAAFERGEHDVLVGTQLVAKGHDFPNVTLVGVVGADFSLGFPDFRAAERTFQILTQVAGRAGRGDRPGRVLIQAHRPDHYAITAAARQDYVAFYAQESRYRKLMGYPPFTAVANVIAAAATIETAERRARAVAAAIRAEARGGLRVVGPAPAPLARLKGRWRFQVMARAADRRRLSAAINAAMDRLDGASSKEIVVDVDPASLM